MGMSSDKFVEGVALAVKVYRDLDNPTPQNAENLVKFIETGLMLMEKNGGMERLIAELGGEMANDLNLPADGEAEVIELDAYRKNGGLIN